MTSGITEQESVASRFKETFGSSPALVARAPGRVEVLGNHTDYNEGVVLSAAIDREVWIAAGKSDSSTCRISSTHFPDTVEVEDITPLKGGPSWANYPLGVYSVLRERGYPVAPVTMAIHSSVPLGAGLSSSAALEVATAIAICALYDLEIDGTELAKICQEAENGFVGANCGLLDQFSSMFGREGHLLHIDFRSLAHETIPLADDDITLAITLSGVTHALVAGEYNARRGECAEASAYFSANDASVNALRDVTMERLFESKDRFDPISYKRALHIVGEDDRVIRGMDFMNKGAISEFGELLYQSHESSRVNFENSCPELDVLVDIARGIEGVYGARLTGGGFGGATLTMLRSDARDNFERVIKEKYRKKTGRETVVHFAKIAEGAGLA